MARDRLVRATRSSAVAAAVLCAVVVASSAFSTLSGQTAAPVQSKTVSIPVEGMSCVSCAARVKRTLKAIEGVQRVEVSLEHREATVRFTPDKVTPDHLEAAINQLGYKAGKSRMVESR